jgi:hypothetical protein
MRSTLKKLILSSFAAVTLLPGVLNTRADAQHRNWRATVRIIKVQPNRPVYYNPVYYYPVYGYPVYSPYLWPAYGAVEPPFSYLQEKGYKEGSDEGEDDAEDGKPPNPAAHEDFYKSYSPVYRQAFIQGYYDAYRRKIID